jgi:hypothetical protein
MKKISKLLLTGSALVLVGLSGCVTNPYHLDGDPVDIKMRPFVNPNDRLEINKLDGVDVFGSAVYLGKSALYLGPEAKFEKVDPLLNSVSLSFSHTFCGKNGGNIVDIKEDYLIRSFYRNFSQPSIYVNENNRIVEPKMIKACKKKNDPTYSSLLLVWRGVGSRNNTFNGDLYKYNTVYYSIIENENVKKYMEYMNEKYITVIKPEEEREIKSRQIAEQERLQKEADKEARKKQEIKEKGERYANLLSNLDKVKVYYPALSFFPGIEGKEVEKAHDLYFAAPLAFSQENPCIISSFAKKSLMINPTSSDELRHISMIELQNINPTLALNASEHARQNMTSIELMVNQANLDLIRNKFGKNVPDSYVSAGAIKQALVGMKLRCSASK